MKQLKDVEYPKLQVSKDKKTYRLLLPISYIRELQEQLGREFKQGEPWEVTLLEGKPGVQGLPLKK